MYQQAFSGSGTCHKPGDVHVVLSAGLWASSFEESDLRIPADQRQFRMARRLIGLPGRRLPPVLL